MAKPRSSAFPAIGVSFSGGIDSSTLVGHLLEQGAAVQPIYVHSGLVWQDSELSAARQFLAAVESPKLLDLVVLELPLADIYEGHWSITGRNVPGAETTDEAVYLPGRNPLLLIKSRLWCQRHGIAQLALGSLKSNPFADATEEFFDQFATVLDQATAGRVQFIRPFANLDKSVVMELGRELPLELTFSCLAPHGQQHCGRCNKCAERMSAFRLANREDLTSYETQTIAAANTAFPGL